MAAITDGKERVLLATERTMLVSLEAERNQTMGNCRATAVGRNTDASGVNPLADSAAPKDSGSPGSDIRGESPVPAPAICAAAA